MIYQSFIGKDGGNFDGFEIGFIQLGPVDFFLYSSSLHFGVRCRFQSITAGKLFFHGGGIVYFRTVIAQRSWGKELSDYLDLRHP
jgi:hypothetical protein